MILSQDEKIGRFLVAFRWALYFVAAYSNWVSLGLLWHLSWEHDPFALWIKISREAYFPPSFISFPFSTATLSLLLLLLSWSSLLLLLLNQMSGRSTIKQLYQVFWKMKTFLRCKNSLSGPLSHGKFLAKNIRENWMFHEVLSLYSCHNRKLPLPFQTLLRIKLAERKEYGLCQSKFENWLISGIFKK